VALVRLLERLLTNASSDVTVVMCVCVCKRKIEKLSLNLLQLENINIRNTLDSLTIVFIQKLEFYWNQFHIPYESAFNRNTFHQTDF